jgi:hypothetical protein
MFLVALAAELGIVFYPSARVQKLTPNVATILFLFYAALNGVTLSVLTLAYGGSSIALTFVVTAGMFRRTRRLRLDDEAQSGGRRARARLASASREVAGHDSGAERES